MFEISKPSCNFKIWFLDMFYPESRPHGFCFRSCSISSTLMSKYFWQPWVKFRCARIHAPHPPCVFSCWGPICVCVTLHPIFHDDSESHHVLSCLSTSGIFLQPQPSNPTLFVLSFWHQKPLWLSLVPLTVSPVKQFLQWTQMWKARPASMQASSWSSKDCWISSSSSVGSRPVFHRRRYGIFLNGK